MSHFATLQCRKCRAVLYENEFVFDGHGAKINKNSESNCKTALDRFCFHEENLSSWMLSAIETSQWTKGKINCPKCGIKIGSFDFVSRNKCECAEYVIPPIYVIKSKTDILLK